MRWRISAEARRAALLLLFAAGPAIAATPWFEDVTASAAIAPLRHGEGVVATDLNGDGRPDLFLPSVREPARLLLNCGDGSFRDASIDSGSAAAGGVGAAAGDLDLDGRPDLYLARGADPYVAPNLVLLQQQDGRFADASAASGVGERSSGLTVLLADFSGDGAPEAFLPGWGRDVLFRNDGRGGLAEVSASAGIAGGGRGWSAVAADFDDDGRLDLFAGHGSPTAPRDNRLYRNRGDGSFEDRTDAAGLATSPWTLGPVAADFDGDGDLDLYVAGYSGAGRLYRNDGSLHFTDVSAASGIAARKVVGAVAGMVDGDLLPDLVLGGFAGPVEIYRNLGGMRFARLGSEAGLQPFPRNEGLTLVDYDDDGDLDLYVSNVEGKNRLYRNRLDDPRFLKLRFPAGGPSLVGTVARLSRNGRLLASERLAGAVGMGQGPQEILFRLPDAEPVDLEVLLPDGRRISRRTLGPGSLHLP